MPTDQPTDARARLLSHFNSAQGSAEHGTKWDELWTEGFLPWDKGFPNPALSDLLSQRQDLLPSPSSQTTNSQNTKKKKALVPGCGKGYDVLLLSAFGYDAYGLEISSKALEEARKVEAEMGGKDVYAARDGVQKGEVHWIAGDFFEEGGGVLGGEKFDLIYDYTVFTFTALSFVKRKSLCILFVC
ncbi:S-adenosyl-L-methionine-dependent methyltransferase [Cadophora sp. DSE1049]|nr:S-adenosyl-L-methionine-dependent methyltransferase [Cadophora sp. DSE1049]